MRCPSCNAKVSESELHCHKCGAQLTDAPEASKQSTSIVPLQSNLPALIYNSPLPRNVAASVGAVAVGVGIELLRRNLLGRLQRRGVASALPALSEMKDLLGPQGNQRRTTKLPRGYEVQESVYYVRRVIRRV